MWNCLELAEDLEILEPNHDGTENGTTSGIIGIVESLMYLEKQIGVTGKKCQSAIF